MISPNHEIQYLYISSFSLEVGTNEECVWGGGSEGTGNQFSHVWPKAAKVKVEHDL